MRIRQVKPSFFSDAKAATLTDGERILYIGLWMMADDAGWLDWDLAEVAAAIYPYRARALREGQVRKRSLALIQTGRLEVHECGHAFLPHLVEHQHLPGNKTLTVRNAHTRESPRFPAGDGGEDVPAFPRVSPQRSGQVRSGQVSSGVAQAHERTNGAGMTAMQIRMEIEDPVTSPAARKAYQKALDRMEGRA